MRQPSTKNEKGKELTNVEEIVAVTAEDDVVDSLHVGEMEEPTTVEKADSDKEEMKQEETGNDEKEEEDMPLETENRQSSKRPNLECAGCVDEKCHPNPNYKRSKLEDIVNGKSNTDVVVDVKEIEVPKETTKIKETILTTEDSDMEDGEIKDGTAVDYLYHVEEEKKEAISVVNASAPVVVAVTATPVSVPTVIPVVQPQTMTSIAVPTAVAKSTSAPLSAVPAGYMDPNMMAMYQAMMTGYQQPTIPAEATTPAVTVQAVTDPSQMANYYNAYGYADPTQIYNYYQMMYQMMQSMQMMQNPAMYMQQQGMMSNTVNPMMANPSMSNTVNPMMANPNMSNTVNPMMANTGMNMSITQSVHAPLVSIPQRRPEEFTEDPADQCKLFVGGMPNEVNEYVLRNYFQQFGPVRNVTVVRFKETGLSRGFGFVEFKSKISIDDVLSIPKHEFFGRVIDMHRCTPNVSIQLTDGGPLCKLFVGGVDDNLSEDTLREALSPFGQVQTVNIIRNQEGRCRGFAFVHFTDQAPVDMLIQRQYLNVNGKRIVFGNANSKKGKNFQSSSGQGMQNMQGGQGSFNQFNSSGSY